MGWVLQFIVTILLFLPSKLKPNTNENLHWKKRYKIESHYTTHWIEIKTNCLIQEIDSSYMHVSKAKSHSLPSMMKFRNHRHKKKKKLFYSYYLDCSCELFTRFYVHSYFTYHKLSIGSVSLCFYYFFFLILLLMRSNFISLQRYEAGEKINKDAQNAWLAIAKLTTIWW